MSNIPTGTNSSPNQPLPKEGKAISAPILNNQENLEGVDRAGWFDEEALKENVFDANSGGQIVFNLPKLDAFPVSQPSQDTLSTASDLFKEGAFVTLGAAKTGAGVLGNIFKETFDAVADVVKTDVAFETPKNEQKDPEKEAEEQKKKIEAQYQNNVMQQTDDEITSIRNKLEMQARMTPAKDEIADLTGLQAMLSGKNSLISESGEVRVDLQTAVAQKRKEIMDTQQGKTNQLASPAKRGSKGPGMSLEDNKSAETHSTAQTAVG